jgi:hypothetical protein
MAEQEKGRAFPCSGPGLGGTARTMPRGSQGVSRRKRARMPGVRNEPKNTNTGVQLDPMSLARTQVLGPLLVEKPARLSQDVVE